MIKEALEYINGLVAPVMNEVDGIQYSDKKLFKIDEMKADIITVGTLSSIVDLIKSMDPRVDMHSVIHVESYKRVVVKSTLRKDLSRAVYFVCEPDLPQIAFNMFKPTEFFNIMLQSCFIETEGRDAVLKVVGNIVENDIREYGDDGMTQEVTARVGIAKKAAIVVPNPVLLQPFRTFIEVDQPESAFVLRLQEGPQAALFEADGGQWKVEATQSIKEYLMEELKDVTGITIVA